MKKLLPYKALFGVRLRTLLQYRVAALAGFTTQLFWGAIRVMIFSAFYAGATTVHPLALPQVISYIWLGQALLALLPWNADPQVAAMIRSGDVGYELLRPHDLYAGWFVRALANRLGPLLLRAGPLLLLAALFGGLGPPVGVAAGLAFVAALLGALLLSAALSTLFNLSLFFTLSADGLARLFPALTILASGMAVPLQLLPEPLGRWLAALPWAGLVDLPYRLYVGALPAASLPLVLLHQLFWTLALVALGRAMLGQALRRLEVQGG